MLKSIFFALLFAASCCPQKPQYHGDFQKIEQPEPVLYAKIDGNVVQYHYSANEPKTYEKKYPELARSLEYIGRGRLWTYNGVQQNDTTGPDTYFWRKK